MLSLACGFAHCHHPAMPLIITLQMLIVNQEPIALSGELELGLWKFED